MGRIPHNFEPGCWYFITSTTALRYPYFKDPENAAIFLNILESHYRKINYELDEFVLMPDHFHIIIIPKQRSLSEIIRDIKRGSARLINIGQNVRYRSIWMPNYRDDKIFDEADLKAKRDYIWLNPVKEKLVELPGNWLYSSANPDVRKRFGLAM